MRRSLLAIWPLTLALACVKPESPSPERMGSTPTDESVETADGSRLAATRRAMVERQIAGRGVADTAVLRAMRTVPRHLFVPDGAPADAYRDHPLPIGYGQTISQPYIVAFMAQSAEIERGDRVLEIGTGSGYGAAVLAEMGAEVFSVEIVPQLAERARDVLGRLGYRNVHVLAGNGWLGWPDEAPFDAVVVTAAPDEVPEPLVEQLAPGGMMVIPVGSGLQTLRVLRKTSEGLREEASVPVRFVPLVGEPQDTGR